MLNTPPAGDPVPRFGDRRRSRVGLLGGSFNPAHEGHRHVAELARRRLRLDQVWLLVSPGNPLKPQQGMAALELRLASARGVADGRRVVASTIERRLGTRFTVDTLRLLQRRFPRIEFVWIAGADIFVQLPRWKGWREIVRRMPFAVVPRPGYNRCALTGRAAAVLRRARRPVRASAILVRYAPPAWVFLTAPQHAVSASAIRAIQSGANLRGAARTPLPGATGGPGVIRGPGMIRGPATSRGPLGSMIRAALPVATRTHLPDATGAKVPRATHSPSQGAEP